MMKTEFQKTLQLLLNYTPSYPEEEVYKEKMIELLGASDDCFLRSCRVGHFTASAFLLNKDKTHVLMMHHAKLDRWMQLGGHCDGNTDVHAVAIKEAQEESGIDQIKLLNEDIFDIDIHLIPSRAKEQAHYHFDIRFLLHAYESDNFVQNRESKELRWIFMTEEEPLSDSESVNRMFRKLKKIQEYS